MLSANNEENFVIINNKTGSNKHHSHFIGVKERNVNNVKGENFEKEFFLVRHSN
jgi:hypothetical protein